MRESVPPRKVRWKKEWAKVRRRTLAKVKQAFGMEVAEQKGKKGGREASMVVGRVAGPRVGAKATRVHVGIVAKWDTKPTRVSVEERG